MDASPLIHSLSIFVSVFPYPTVPEVDTGKPALKIQVLGILIMYYYVVILRSFDTTVNTRTSGYNA
jgi:hypothetical protein